MISRIRQFNFARYWASHVAPHLLDDDVQDALNQDMQDYFMMLRARFGANDFCVWKPGDPPYDIGRGPLNGQRVYPYKLSWYQPWGRCHWIVSFSRALGTKIFPHLRWGVMTSDRHSIALGVSPWTGTGRKVLGDDTQAYEARVVMDILLFKTCTAVESLDDADEHIDDQTYEASKRERRQAGTLQKSANRTGIQVFFGEGYRCYGS